MLRYLTAPGVLAIWLVVAQRIRWHKKMASGGRRLTIILTSLAFSVTLKLAVVGDVVDAALGVIGIQVLLRDALAIFMGGQSVLAVYEITHRVQQRRGDHVAHLQVLVRVIAIVVGGCLLTMTVSWYLTPPGKPGLLRMDLPSGRGAALVYWVVYTATYAALIVVVARITLTYWGKHRGHIERVDARLTRTCMGLFGLASLSAGLYLTFKAATLVCLVVGYAPAWLVHLTVPMQQLPQLGAIACLVLSGIWTSPTWLTRRLGAPWRYVTRDEKDARLLAAGWQPEERLYRRCFELHENCARLSRWVPASVEPLLEEMLTAIPVERRAYVRDGALVGLGRRLKASGHPRPALPAALTGTTAEAVDGKTKTVVEWACDLLTIWSNLDTAAAIAARLYSTHPHTTQQEPSR